MVITDPGDTMGPGSMSDLATATMVGGVGRLGLFTYGLLFTGRGVPSSQPRRTYPMRLLPWLARLGAFLL